MPGGWFIRVVFAFFLMATGACSSLMTGSSGTANYNFTIKHPEEWKKINTAKYYILTKDGPYKQYILAQQRPLDKPFKHSQDLIKKDMSPREAAQVIVDEVVADTFIRDFETEGIFPVTLGPYEGFMITWSYTTKKGYDFLGLCYGFVIGEWFYSLRYNATEKHYCDADITAFHEVLASFTLKDAGS